MYNLTDSKQTSRCLDSMGEGGEIIFFSFMGVLLSEVGYPHCEFPCLRLCTKLTVWGNPHLHCQKKKEVMVIGLNIKC